MNSHITAGRSQRALVTGATGLLGNNLVRALLENGFEVTALSRSREKADAQLGGLPVQHVLGDVLDVTSFAAALQGIDVVFHTAAFFRDSYKGGSHREELLRTNVQATASLLETAYTQGVRRFVHVSSIALLDGPRDALINETMTRNEADADDYYLSKILAEREVRRFLDSHPDFWAAFVLPGWMHGPGDAGPTSAGQMVLDFLHARLPGVPPTTMSFVDARDVAAAAIAVNSRGRRGERYLAAGRNISMKDLMGLIERVSGVSAPKREVPLTLLRAIAFGSELWARVTRKPILLSTATVNLLAREAGRTQFDHSKSRAELGLQFRPTEDTLRDEIAWYRDNGWLQESAIGSEGRTLQRVLA